MPRSHVYHCVSAVLGAVSFVGLITAASVHFATLCGVDPGLYLGPHLKDFWVFQLILFGAILPILLELLVLKQYRDLLRSPHWMRVMLYILTGYYAISFYVFIILAAIHLDARQTWRMFSAGWILLFWVAVIFYRTRFFESNPPGTLPSA